MDPRWQEPTQLKLIKDTYNAIINNTMLIHCYIENRDECHHKTSSIPLGINPREMLNGNIDYIIKYMDNYPPIKDRILKAICLHRDRPGDREIINKYKVKEWCEFVEKDVIVKHDSFYKLLQTFPFIICAHGGGIDPCPKVWEALCVGCIPIIKHSALDDVYSQFPIVFVDSWEKNTINLENLTTWIEQYSKYYDDKDLRNKWVHKLYLNYWEEKIRNNE